MNKRIVTALVLGLLVGGMLAVPVEAAKKKKPKVKPVTVAMFLRDEVEGCDGGEALQWTDGPDTSACSYLTNGTPNDVLVAAGEDPLLTVWPAVPGAGAEFQLNTDEDIVAKFAMRSSTGRAESPVRLGTGQFDVNVSLTGTLASGEEAQIAEGSGTYTATPTASFTAYPVEFQMEPDAALNKQKFSSLQLNAWIGGTGVMSGWFVLDDPASYFTMSILTKGGKLPAGATPPPAGEEEE